MGMTGEPPNQATQIRIFLKNIGSAHETWVKLKKISAREKLPELEDLANDLVDEAREHPNEELENQARFTSHKKPWNSKGRHQAENDDDAANQRKRRCFHCGKPGHFIKECEDFLAGIRQQISNEKKNIKETAW